MIPNGILFVMALRLREELLETCRLAEAVVKSIISDADYDHFHKATIDFLSETAEQKQTHLFFFLNFFTVSIYFLIVKTFIIKEMCFQHHRTKLHRIQQ